MSYQGLSYFTRLKRQILVTKVLKAVGKLNVGRFFLFTKEKIEMKIITKRKSPMAGLTTGDKLGTRFYITPLNYSSSSAGLQSPDYRILQIIPAPETPPPICKVWRRRKLRAIEGSSLGPGLISRVPPHADCLRHRGKHRL